MPISIHIHIRISIRKCFSGIAGISNTPHPPHAQEPSKWLLQ